MRRRFYRPRNHRRSNIISIPTLKPICTRIIKRTHVLHSKWEFGDGLYDNDYKSLDVSSWKLFENANPQWNQQYGQYIVNNALIVISGIDVNRYFVTGKLDKINNSYVNLKVDPMFSLDTFNLCTVMKTDTRWGIPLVDHNYEHVRKHRVRPGKKIVWRYYPRCRKRSATSGLTTKTTFNDMLVSCNSRDLTTNRCTVLIGFEIDSNVLPRQNDNTNYYQYIVNYTVDVYFKLTLTDRNVDATL